MTRSRLVNVLLLAAVALLAVLPVALGAGAGKEEPFGGADAEAERAITENDPDYEPWYDSLYTPASEEISSGLFAAQAALGAGVIGYVLGTVRAGRRPSAAQSPPSAASAEDG